MTRMMVVAALLVAGSTACTKELVCPTGEAACGGHCVSLLTDPQNCGACGRAVTALQVCSAGTATCAPGIGLCGSECTDLARDAANCGACGAACAASDFCTTAGGVTSCTATCPAGFTACGRACVDTTVDRFDCGACGNTCAAGESCRMGACRADMQVACYATNEVRPVATDLSPAGPPRGTPAGPTALAMLGGAVYSANGYPSASVSVLPLDPGLPSRHVPVAGSDLEHIGAYDNAVLVSNASVGTLLVLAASGDILGEIALPDQQSGPNPHGFAEVGTEVYAALYGTGPSSGQKIAKVDLSGLTTCAATAGAPCGAVSGTIDLASIPGAADAPGLPFPSEVLAVGGTVYVTLANLEADTISCGTGCTYTLYVKPAGSGKLAVVTAGADTVSIVDLGPSCANPGGLALQGTTLWVSCGSYSYPALAPSVVLPVDLSRSPPLPGTALAIPAIVPGKLAFCRGVGYVTDQASGAIVRFDPVARTVEDPVVVCPTSLAGWAWAADIACSE